VAFEMAHQLRILGHEVALLALLDAPAPGTYSSIDDPGSAAHTTRVYSVHFRKYLPLSPNELEGLELDEQLNYILEKLKIANLVPSEFGLQEIRRFLEGHRARERAMTQYIPSIYNGRITLFRASAVDSELAVAIQELYLRDPTGGWSRLSSEQVDVHVIPGNHNSLLEEPHVQTLANTLSDCIDEALSIKGAGKFFTAS
jgi:thioesterase domain-containing protein